MPPLAVGEVVGPPLAVGEVEGPPLAVEEVVGPAMGISREAPLCSLEDWSMWALQDLGITPTLL